MATLLLVSDLVYILHNAVLCVLLLLAVSSAKPAGDLRAWLGSLCRLAQALFPAVSFNKYPHTNRVSLLAL